MLRRADRDVPAARPRLRLGLPALFAAALVIRLALIGVTAGQDFRVWDLASAATLRGVDIYAHHPAYPGGPYAYLPLFMWIEVPFQWLAQQGWLSFTVLGKLPILAADLAVGWLVRAAVLRRGGSPRRAVLAAGAVLFNPLVLYNSAFYGRFDTVALALLLAAVVGLPRGDVPARRAWLFALAVAAKTFPLVALPALLRRGWSSAGRVVLALAGTFAVLLLPYWHSLPAVFHDVVLYDARKPAQALSWHQLFAGNDLLDTLVVVICVGWLVAVAVSPGGRDVERFTLLAVLLFLLADKVVLEQYLIWPMPFLVLTALGRSGRSRVELASAWLLYAICTAIGLLVNPYVHPFGTAPVWLAAALAVAMAAHAAVLTVPGPLDDRCQDGPTGLRA